MSRQAEKLWHEMLNQLSGRDAPVELSRRGKDDDKSVSVVYRSRMFTVEPDGCIIVERPQQAIRDHAFGSGDDIELLLSRNGERVLATCTIRKTFVHSINKEVDVSCFRLSPGRRPAIEQRREFFRVNVAALDLAPVLLVPFVDQDDAAQDDESIANDSAPERYQSRLVNVSAGGVGVSVRARRDILSTIKRTPAFTCTVSLMDSEAIIVPVRVAHIEAIGDDGLYLGLQFQFADEKEERLLQDRMVSICTGLQRMQLQKRRA